MLKHQQGQENLYFQVIIPVILIKTFRGLNNIIMLKSYQFSA